MATGRQSDIGANTSRSLEARRIVDRRLEAERSDRTDTGRGHESADLHIMTRQLQNLTVEIADLLFDGLARLEQRPHRGHQLGTILDQFLGPHGKDIWDDCDDCQARRSKRLRLAKGLPFSSSRIGRKGRCVTHSITSSARASRVEGTLM